VTNEQCVLRLNYMTIELEKLRVLNQVWFLILGTVDLNLEIKFVGKLFHWVNQRIEIWRRRISVT